MTKEEARIDALSQKLILDLLETANADAFPLTALRCVEAAQRLSEVREKNYMLATAREALEEHRATRWPA